MKLIKKSQSIMLMLCLAFLVSCGGSAPMVDNVEVQTRDQDGDVLVTLTADLAIGNLALPFASFPIILKNGKEAGTVTLGTSTSGQSQIVIDINVSDSINFEMAQVRLPNGALMPIIMSNSAIEIPLGKVKLVLSLINGQQSLGIIIPIKSFDKIGEKVGTTSLMPIFNKNGVLGAAGVYTSSEAGKNGFALVTDLSGVLPNIFPVGQVAQQREEADVSSELMAPSRSEKKSIDKALLRMHKKKAKLELN